MVMEELVTPITQATWPELEPGEPLAHQAIAPRCATPSTGTPESSAARFQIAASPQWWPWYQLWNAIPTSWLRRQATNDVHSRL